jgi:hypothetical protein
VLPEVVQSIKGGKYLGVKYPELIPLLIEAVRELDERTQSYNATSSATSAAAVAVEEAVSDAVNEANDNNNATNSNSTATVPTDSCNDVSALVRAISDRLSHLESSNSVMRAKLSQLQDPESQHTP